MKYVTPKDLLDWGLIFEINRKVLHPFGLALAVEVDGMSKVSFSSEVWDYRDDPEGIRFAPEVFEHGQDKYLKFLDEQGYNALTSRKESLGYIEQNKLDSEEE
jgi:hypothetical protein